MRVSFSSVSGSVTEKEDDNEDEKNTLEEKSTTCHFMRRPADRFGRVRAANESGIIRYADKSADSGRGTTCSRFF
jgi:hypothetical protein